MNGPRPKTAVVLIRPSDLSPHLGAGFGTPGVEVCIPLTADCLLILHNAENDGQVVVLPPIGAGAAGERSGRAHIAAQFSASDAPVGD